MSYKPNDAVEFFNHVGEKFVNEAVINGEIDSELADQARHWLALHKQAKEEQHRVIATVIAIVAILVPVAYAASQANEEPQKQTATAESLFSAELPREVCWQIPMVREQPTSKSVKHPVSGK